MKSKKGRKKTRKINKDKSTSATQERRQHARRIRTLQARKERGGGVAPRQNNSMAESRAAKVKAKAIQESNGKRQHERTKTSTTESTPGIVSGVPGTSRLVCVPVGHADRFVRRILGGTAVWLDREGYRTGDTHTTGYPGQGISITPLLYE